MKKKPILGDSNTQEINSSQENFREGGYVGPQVSKPVLELNHLNGGRGQKLKVSMDLCQQKDFQLLNVIGEALSLE